MSYCIIPSIRSHHINTYHIVSIHIILYQHISINITSYWYISHHINTHIKYHIISTHINKYHIISTHINKYHIISINITSYQHMSHHIDVEGARASNKRAPSHFCLYAVYASISIRTRLREQNRAELSSVVQCRAELSWVITNTMHNYVTNRLRYFPRCKKEERENAIVWLGTG